VVGELVSMSILVGGVVAALRLPRRTSPHEGGLA
jgi:hypothetical protein